MPLVNEIGHKSVAAVQPLVYLFDKKTINLTGKVTHYLGFDWLKDFKQTKIPKKQRIYSLSGSGVLFDKEVFLQLGGFDELYFMYYEDSDLSWKLQLVNKKIMFVPESKLYHDYKYIPKEIIICLYDQGFSNWDCYITNYLTLLKSFRLTLNKIFSKNEINKYIGRLGAIHLDKSGITQFYTELDKYFSFALTKIDTNQFITLK